MQLKKIKFENERQIPLFSMFCIQFLFSISLLLTLIFSKYFQKSFKSVTDRTVINILIILLSTKNCIELTLNYAEFCFPAETSIIPENYIKICYPLYHMNILSILLLSFFQIFIVLFERFSSLLRNSKTLELCLVISVLLLPVSYVVFNIIIIGDHVYMELYNLRLSDFSEDGRILMYTSITIMVMFTVLNICFLLFLVINVYLCSSSIFKIFNALLYRKIVFSVRFHIFILPSILLSFISFLLSMNREILGSEYYKLGFIMANTSCSIILFLSILFFE